MRAIGPAESVILCEGYHDRAFWSGWLLALNCSDLRPLTGEKTKDPWGKVVAKGAYAFRSASGRFIRVSPVQGVGNILGDAIGLLKLRTTHALDHLVITVDSDAVEGDTEQRSAGHTIKDVLATVTREGMIGSLDANGDLIMDGDGTRVSLVRWEAADASGPGLPSKQTLERLVCAAICAAYPERGENVHAWLASRHKPPKETVKEYAWSYYAGWLATHGTDHFYRCLWDDPRVRPELRARLTGSGAWRIADAIAE